MKASYDVVVIGAGISGLTSAALLSRAGLSVGVFEMDAGPGGYLAGYQRAGFRVETAIHWLNQCGPNGLVTRIFDIIGSDHPVAPPLKRIKRYLGNTHDYLLTDDPDMLKAELIDRFPRDKKGIERFFGDAKQLGRSFDGLPLFARSQETMGLGEKIRFKARRLKFASNFIKHLRWSGVEGTEKGLKRYFKDPELRQLFCSEEALLAALVPIGWAYFGDYQSPPTGGSQVFPEWLAHVVASLGNDICYKCRVRRVELQDGKAVGVTLDRPGETLTVKCGQIIAACDVETLYEKMLPPGAVPGETLDKLRGAELYSSAVSVSLGLDCPPEALGFKEEVIFLNREDVARPEHNRGDPAKCGINILAPSFRDRTLAPAGRGALTICCYATFDQGERWKTERDAGDDPVRGEAYNRYKVEFADQLIDRVAGRLNIDLRSHIEFCDIATPITHWRYTGNRDGSIMGARPNKANYQAGIAHHGTPVRNLWLGGHWADLGGGVPIAVQSGLNAALLVLQNLRPEVFRVLARYVDGKIDRQEAEGTGVLAPYDSSWIRALTPAERRALSAD